MRGAQVADAWVTQMRAERDKSRQPDRAAQSSRRQFWSAHDWALRHGFSEDQAPFAAVAASSIKFGLHGRAVTAPELASLVRGRCRSQWPGLFGGAS